MSKRPSPIRVVTFSTLYPNFEQPDHGVFVENRLRHLIATGEVASRVVAPVGWVPFDSPIFGRHQANARVPSGEARFGVSILHPRYLIIPKIGMTMAPALLFAGALRVLKRLQ